MAAVNSSGEATAATRVTPPPPPHSSPPRHRPAAPHSVLIDLHSVHPVFTKEERYAFSLQDLYLNVVDITDVFMVSSRQLFRTGFAAAEHYQADPAKLQVDVP